VFLTIPLFNKMPKTDLFQLVSELPIEEYKRGDYLFREGEHGDSLYVVRDGKVEIILAADTADEMLLRACGPGEYVGEMSLLMPEGTRTASVRAREDSIVWVMSREKFNQALHKYPQLAYSMIE